MGNNQGDEYDNMPNGIGPFDPRHSSQTHHLVRNGTVATDMDATDEVPNMYGS